MYKRQRVRSDLGLEGQILGLGPGLVPKSLLPSLGKRLLLTFWSGLIIDCMVLCHPLQKLFTVDQVMMYYCRSHGSGSRKLCFLAVDVEVLLPITSAAYSSQVQQQYSVCVCVCVCVRACVRACVRVRNQTKPLDMQASSIYCLSQARKNWEDCGRKGIRCKNGGRMEVTAPIVWMGWHLYCL